HRFCEPGACSTTWRSPGTSHLLAARTGAPHRVDRNTEGGLIGITSLKLSRLPGLKAFLNGADHQFLTPWNLHRAKAIAGWGGRPSGIKASQLARTQNIPCLLVEDGFLRSVAPSHPPLSVIIEQGGLYHDATRCGRLDELLDHRLSTAQEARATALIEAWKSARVSKFNHLRDYVGALPQPYVLVVDQLRGDASIAGGSAGPESFRAMLDAALAEHPGCTIIIKPHPLVANRRRAGYFDAKELGANPRVRFLHEPCSPVRLI